MKNKKNCWWRKLPPNLAKLCLGLAKQASTALLRGLYNRSLKPTTKDPLCAKVRDCELWETRPTACLTHLRLSVKSQQLGRSN